MAYERQAKARSQPQQHVDSAGALWIEANGKELYEKYGGEWVAADSSGLVAHDKSIDELMKKVSAAGKQAADVAVRFLFIRSHV
ncbi:MAG: hypothetical protein Greene07144_582 [Parcubacteria group bacterium Greene0714_4]|nr:MAG: hypothetical protein Greene101415_671 [Parcubacteria group bacterium Greene1014_15]TSD07952.1 MAG: hypothetical protein Greene07144_582 [Parcubacteria group bacterium Greene0714_4]